MNTTSPINQNLSKFFIVVNLVLLSLFSYSNDNLNEDFDKKYDNRFFNIESPASVNELINSEILESYETLNFDDLASPPGEGGTTDGVDTTQFDAAFSKATIKDEGNFNNENFIDLPVGISKDFGGGANAQLIVVNAYFTKDYIMLDLLAKVVWNGKDVGGKPVKRTLRMGCWGAKYYYKFGFSGDDLKLALLENIIIPIEKDGSNLKLIGKLDKNTGQIDNNTTYLKFGCNGIESLEGNFVGKLTVKSKGTNTTIKPVTFDKKTGKYKTDNNKSYLEVDFKANCSLLDFYFSTSLSPFTIGNTDVIFDVNQLTVDLSSTQSPSIKDDNKWEGFYVQKFNLYLPESFSKDNNGKKERVSVGATDLCVDELGISGVISAKNLSSLKNGSAGGFPLSVNSLDISLKNSELTAFDIEGAVRPPVLSDTDSIKYTASLNPVAGKYIFTIDVKDKKPLGLDVFLADLTIGGGGLELTKDGISPGVDLFKATITGGSIGLKGDKLKDFAIAFDSFMVSNAPALFIKTVSPDPNSKAGKLSNFPITLDKFAFADNKLILGLQINLMKDKISGAVDATIFCKQQEVNGRQKWKYDGTKINEIAVAASFKKFSIKGKVEMFDEVKDNVSNKGFSGALDFKMALSKDSLNIKADAIFGAMKDISEPEHDFRYWNVNLMASGFKIDLFSGVQMTGIGGGAAYNMRNDGGEFVADSSYGLFLRANTFLLIGGSGEDNPSQVALEMQFLKTYNGGGLSYIQLFGDISLSPSADLIPGATALMDGYKKISKITVPLQEKLKDISKGVPRILDNTDFSERSPSMDLSSAAAKVKIQLILKMDFDNDIFTGAASAYVIVKLNETSPPIIEGRNSKNGDGLAGSVYMVFRKDEWFIHAGYQYYSVTGNNLPIPNPGKVKTGLGFQPIGLEMKIGTKPINLASVCAYFLVGHHIPELPNPKTDLGISGFPDEGLAEKPSRGPDSNFDGLGLAFGAAANFKIDDIQFLILYANFNAYMGFDVLLKKYENCPCPGWPQGQKFGMNNWWAQGQAYAGLGAEIGVQVKVFGKVKRVPALSANMAILLQAKLPNPSWFSGILTGNYNVLGGAVKGSFSMNCTFGDACGAVEENGQVELPVIKIVNSTYPIYEEGKSLITISPFDTPSITFNFDFNKNFTFAEEFDTDGTFELRCDNVQVRYISDDPAVPVTIVSGLQKIWSGNKKMLIDFTSKDLYWDNNKKVEIKVDYSLWVKHSLTADHVYEETDDDGVTREFRESKTFIFMTGEKPNELSENSIVEMYPAIDQEYFYTGHTDKNDGIVKGFIEIDRQGYLFATSTASKIYFNTPGQADLESVVTYNGYGKLEYTVPALILGSTYTAVLEKKGTEDTSPVKVFEFSFHTSSYPTFVAKVADMGSIVSRANYDDSQILFSFQYSEPFGREEILGNKYMNYNNPLVTAIIDFSECESAGVTGNISYIDFSDLHLITTITSDLSFYNSDWEILKPEMESESSFPYAFITFNSLLDEIGNINDAAGEQIGLRETNKYTFPLKLSYSGVPGHETFSKALAMTYNQQP